MADETMRVIGPYAVLTINIASASPFEVHDADENVVARITNDGDVIVRGSPTQSDIITG